MKWKKACKQLECEKDMYCFGGKDKTVHPRLCDEARKLVVRKVNK